MTVDSSSAASRSVAEAQRQIERELRSQLATVTGGLAPDDYMRAWWDWYLHLAGSRDKQQSLAQGAWNRVLDNWSFAANAAAGTPTPPATDARFAGEAWNRWPFNVYAHAYGNWESWWKDALGPVPGMPVDSARKLEFVGRQMLDAVSPANYLPTNPELLERTRAESGQNLVRGFKHWLEDTQRTLAGRGPVGTECYVVGRDLAITPGKVVLRNRLIELIQYSPQTENVYAEPILITPAWIMKYYILDLSPKNSLVRYLVEQGHTVFMISWRNPTAADRDLGMDDYLQLGLRDALDAVTAIVPGRKVHAMGYCIGGTLLSIGAAALAGEGDQRLQSVTMLAAQTDFSEPGELSVFISPSQLAMLEAIMHKAGVLKSEQMGGAFMLLRSADLLWAPAVESYVRGQRPGMNDLMAWNADGTRMPWRMHTEYLRRLYLLNDLGTGRFDVAGQPIDLAKVTVPMFVVGTETDHVAPWHSVYKTRALTRSNDYTFLLTSGGHNAGIISGPSHPKRRHRVLTWTDSTTVVPPAEWLANTPVRAGSWWPTWEQWLAQHSSAERVAPPLLGNAGAGYAALEDAPGTYIFQ